MTQQEITPGTIITVTGQQLRGQPAIQTRTVNHEVVLVMATFTVRLDKEQLDAAVEARDAAGIIRISIDDQQNALIKDFHWTADGTVIAVQLLEDGDAEITFQPLDRQLDKPPILKTAFNARLTEQQGAGHRSSKWVLSPNNGRIR